MTSDRPPSFEMIDTDALLKAVREAASAGHLTEDAAKNIAVWLEEPEYAEYAPEVAQHIESDKWQQLDDVFWTVIPFGTGGRRGAMYPIGTNAINDRTMGESAQGLADYVREQHEGSGTPGCAIAYDSRHRSRHFAELCAEIMVAAGFQVFFLDGIRSTPELSVATRHFKCACGIMITASHNPPSDNAVKAYWSTGGQLLPPHDRGVIERVMNVKTIERVPFDEARAAGKVQFVQDEADRVYQQGVLTQNIPGPRDIKVLYSPMHGVGASAVRPVLEQAGFADVELFGPHAEPDGDFPNVPNHVANPENPRTFDAPIVTAKEIGADLVLSTDPDADRLGCAAPKAKGGDWTTFTGNQIAALLTDFVCSKRQAAGTLSDKHYLAKTLVTTEMVRRIGEHYGVPTHGNLLVGFKWIGGLIDEQGPDGFVLGIEESHGYLAGTYARDKDAAVAALLLASLAAEVKAQGQTLYEKLEALYWQFGYHAEQTTSKQMPGSEGMANMKRLMEQLRDDPPRELGGMAVVRTRDYGRQRIRLAEGDVQTMDGPQGDMVIFDLAEEGNYVAVRPSGTEPKVKFYLFAYEPAEQLANLDDTRVEVQQRMDAVHADLAALADAV